MQIAAIIFLISGLAYLSWGVSLILIQGIGVGLLLMVIISAALLSQAFELFKNKGGARWRAIVSSGAIVLASGYVASNFLLPPLPQSLLGLPREAWPVFGGAVVVCVAHATVVLVLALKKQRPNNVFNRTR